MKIEFHHLFASTVAVDKSDHFLRGNSCSSVGARYVQGPSSPQSDWASSTIHVMSCLGQSCALTQAPPHTLNAYLDSSWEMHCFGLSVCESFSMSKQAPGRDLDGQSLLMGCQEAACMWFTSSALQQSQCVRANRGRVMAEENTLHLQFSFVPQARLKTLTVVIH